MHLQILPFDERPLRKRRGSGIGSDQPAAVRKSEPRKRSQSIGRGILRRSSRVLAPSNSLNCLTEPHANANITIIIARVPQTMTKAIAPRPSQTISCCGPLIWCIYPMLNPPGIPPYETQTRRGMQSKSIYHAAAAAAPETTKGETPE